MMLTTTSNVKQQLNKYSSFTQSRTEKIKGLEEILEILGLQLSPSELECLCDGKFVSLEHLSIADLGTVLILANAIASQNFQRKNTSFRDLLNLNGSSNSFGVPLYCWDNNGSVKCYLRLTFLTGSPAIVIQDSK